MEPTSSDSKNATVGADSISASFFTDLLRADIESAPANYPHNNKEGGKNVYIFAPPLQFY